jgi:hypothetical protein
MKPPRNGKCQRQRGDRFEREFVNFMREGDVPAQRVPLSGATDFHKGDVVLKPACLPSPLIGELKRRKSLPEWIVGALGEHDFMAMREDNGKTLVVITIDHFRDLLQ